MRSLISFLALVFFISGCASSTSIKGSWKDQVHTSDRIEKVAILAVADNEGNRRIVEGEIAEAFSNRGLDASESYAILSSELLNEQPGKEQVQAILEAEGYDALIRVTLMDTREKVNYSPGTTTYYGPYGYRGFRGYYWAPVYHDPGYYYQTTNYFLGSNLYLVDSGALIWSAQSETVSPGNLKQFARSYAKQIVRQLSKDQVPVASNPNS